MKNASPTGSVTIWLAELKAGDSAAAKVLWDGYFSRLVRLARARLWAVPRVAADEEDVALSAFDSFCRAAASGRFPRLNDRDDLWQVLFVITTRKAIDLARRVNRGINGGNANHASSAGGGSEIVAAGLMSAVAAREPLPEVVAEVTEAWGGCSASWVIKESCVQWQSGRWKGTRTRRSPRSSASPSRQ